MQPSRAGTPESTMLALGRMSRAMLERYSHIRMAAKREAVECLNFEKAPQKPDGVPRVSPKVTEAQQVN